LQVTKRVFFRPLKIGLQAASSVMGLHLFLRWPTNAGSLSYYTVSQKTSLFRDTIDIFYPILLILGKTIFPEDLKQSTYAQPSTSRVMF